MLLTADENLFIGCFFALTYSIHFNENNCSTANGAACMDGPGNTSIDADGNHAIIIRELKEAAFQNVRSLTAGPSKTHKPGGDHE